MHVDVRHKTEQRFIAFLISYASCTCVRCVNQCKCHVRDVAREYFVANTNTTMQSFIIYLGCNAVLYAASAASRFCCTLEQSIAGMLNVADAWILLTD